MSCRHDPCLHLPVQVFFMSGTAFYDVEFRISQSEAQLYHPPSYVDDQHNWKLEVSRTDEPDDLRFLELQARWFCLNCGASFSRRLGARHASFGFAADDVVREFALGLLRLLLRECSEEGVHPGCSEFRTMSDVMRS